MIKQVGAPFVTKNVV